MNHKYTKTVELTDDMSITNETLFTAHQH